MVLGVACLRWVRVRAYPVPRPGIGPAGTSTGLLAPKDLPTRDVYPWHQTRPLSVVIGHFHERTFQPLKKGAEAVYCSDGSEKANPALASLSLQLSYRHLTLLQHIYAAPL